MSHIIQTNPVLLVGLLFSGRFLFPFTHPLGSHRGRALIHSLHGSFSHGRRGWSRWSRGSGWSILRRSLTRHLRMRIQWWGLVLRVR